MDNPAWSSVSSLSPQGAPSDHSPPVPGPGSPGGYNRGKLVEITIVRKVEGKGEGGGWHIGDFGFEEEQGDREERGRGKAKGRVGGKVRGFLRLDS